MVAFLRISFHDGGLATYPPLIVGISDRVLLWLCRCLRSLDGRNKVNMIPESVSESRVVDIVGLEKIAEQVFQK